MTKWSQALGLSIASALVASALTGCAAGEADAPDVAPPVAQAEVTGEAKSAMVELAAESDQIDHGCTLQYTCTWRTWSGCQEYGWCWGHNGVCTTGCN